MHKNALIIPFMLDVGSWNLEKSFYGKLAANVASSGFNRSKFIQRSQLLVCSLSGHLSKGETISCSTIYVRNLSFNF